MVEKRRFKKGFQPLAEMTPPIVDPILRRRAGLSLQLLESWPEIAGPDMAEASRPLKIIWPRRAAADDTFAPGTLVVACEGFSAMKLQHENSRIVQRVNGFFGYCAVARLRIEQKPVRLAAGRPLRDRRVVDDEQIRRLEQLTAEIGDDALRRSLFRLGTGIVSDKSRGQQ